MRRISPEMTMLARELRKNATPQEKKLWYEFLRFHPAHFRRQQPIGPYIADFYCSSAKLVIELDGNVHDKPEQFAYDRERDKYMQTLELRVLRFQNREIEDHFSLVCDVIEQSVSAGAKRPFSQPSADSSPKGGAL